MRANLNPLLLAHIGPMMNREIHSLISDKDYSYFSGHFEEVFRKELAELAYHACRASTILASGATCREEVFLPDLLH